MADHKRLRWSMEVYQSVVKPTHHCDTLTESASDNGRERTSFPKIWATNSTTGSASMNALADISDWSKTMVLPWPPKTYYIAFILFKKEVNIKIRVTPTNIKGQPHLSRSYTLIEATPWVHTTSELMRLLNIRRIE